VSFRSRKGENGMIKQPKENWIYFFMIIGGCTIAALLGLLIH
jgi:hypothetical protein